MEIPRPEQTAAGIVFATLPGLRGWTLHLAPDGAATLRPPRGVRVTQAAWRKVPIGAVMAAAYGLTEDQRVDAAVAAISDWAGHDWRPGVQRDAQVAAAYRSALAQVVPPRVVIARLWSITESKAAIWIADLRDRGVIGAVAAERKAAAR